MFPLPVSTSQPQPQTCPLYTCLPQPHTCASVSTSLPQPHTCPLYLPHCLNLTRAPCIYLTASTSHVSLYIYTNLTRAPLYLPQPHTCPFISTPTSYVPLYIYTNFTCAPLYLPHPHVLLCIYLTLTRASLHVSNCLNLIRAPLYLPQPHSCFSACI